MTKSTISPEELLLKQGIEHATLKGTKTFHFRKHVGCSKGTRERRLWRAKGGNKDAK